MRWVFANGHVLHLTVDEFDMFYIILKRGEVSSERLTAYILGQRDDIKSEKTLIHAKMYYLRKRLEGSPVTILNLTGLDGNSAQGIGRMAVYTIAWRH